GIPGNPGNAGISGIPGFQNLPATFFRTPANSNGNLNLNLNSNQNVAPALQQAILQHLLNSQRQNPQNSQNSQNFQQNSQQLQSQWAQMIQTPALTTQKPPQNFELPNFPSYESIGEKLNAIQTLARALQSIQHQYYTTPSNPYYKPQ